LAQATDTARIALAPSRDLFSVPSRSISTRSMWDCSATSRPRIASVISVLTCSTAFSTPLPKKRWASPSRNSIASRVPVDAPEGTAARPMAPDSTSTSASTVGLPRESRISRATTSTIAVMHHPLVVCRRFYVQTQRRRHKSGWWWAQSTSRTPPK
jgi:hypothetical protein